MSSYEELKDDESIYASTCVYVLTLDSYTATLKYYYSHSTSTMPDIENEIVNSTTIFTYPDDLGEDAANINLTNYIEPFVLAIDDDGTLGVKDASNSFLWTVSDKYESSGAAPYFLRVEDNGEIAVYDHLNTLIWDSSEKGIANDPITELFEILVFVLYLVIFIGYLFFILFRVAYLTRNRKNYTRDSEAGAMHYTKRSEIRTKLAETMTLGGPETAGGPSPGGMCVFVCFCFLFVCFFLLVKRHKMVAMLVSDCFCFFVLCFFFVLFVK